MDLARMLEKCRRDQWTLDELDWTQRPRELSRDDEIAVVQYFTNGGGSEKPGAAFLRGRGSKRKAPTLRAFLEGLVVDEERPREAAPPPARHYDVHRFRTYATNPAL